MGLAWFVSNLGGECRRGWCQCRSVTWRDPRAKGRGIHRRILGPGESTAKSPSKALHIPGINSILLFIFFLQISN